MGKVLIIFSFLIVISCGEKPKLHIADLDKPSVPLLDITLFIDEFDIESTEPTHNIMPGHGKTEKGRVIWLLDENCKTVSDYRVCYTNDFINSRLKMTISYDNEIIDAKPLGGTIIDIFKRFLGAPTAQIYSIVHFGPNTFGLTHTYGFTIFYKNKFCKTFQKNPNSRLFLGISNSGAPLIFSTPALTRVDRKIEGWHEYNLNKLCH